MSLSTLSETSIETLGRTGAVHPVYINFVKTVNCSENISFSPSMGNAVPVFLVIVVIKLRKDAKFRNLFTIHPIC